MKTVYVMLGVGIILTIIGLILLSYGRNISRTNPTKASSYNIIGLVFLVFGLFAVLNSTRVLF